jgi:hypothetical protein
MQTTKFDCNPFREILDALDDTANGMTVTTFISLLGMYIRKSYACADIDLNPEDAGWVAAQAAVYLENSGLIVIEPDYDNLEISLVYKV